MQHDACVDHEYKRVTTVLYWCHANKKNRWLNGSSEWLLICPAYQSLKAAHLLAGHSPQAVTVHMCGPLKATVTVGTLWTVTVRYSSQGTHRDSIKVRGHILVWVPPRLVFSYLVSARLALSGFLIIFNIYIFKEYEYPFHISYLYNIPKGTSQLQSVLLTVISMFGSGLFWDMQDKTRRHKTKQGVALCEPYKPRMMSPDFEK